MSKVSQGGRKNKLRWRLLTLATIVFFLAAGTYFVIVPIQKSKRLEQTLIEKYDWANKYTPPANGFLPPERVEGFMRVREAVQANCATFQGILDNIIGLEEIESNPEMSAGEKASEGFGSLKTILGSAPGFLEFMDARNQALLTEDMGLGEYIYIYLAAYGPQLAAEASSRYADQEDAYISHRARDEYIQILRNQADALDTTDHEASHVELIATLQAEIDSLKDSMDSSPWPDGPPLATRESLAPYQPQIDDLYCKGIVKVELLQKNRGLNLEG
jgi:hypothetical protein